jgi:hypothetical protein
MDPRHSEDLGMPGEMREVITTGDGTRTLQLLESMGLGKPEHVSALQISYIFRWSPEGAQNFLHVRFPKHIMVADVEFCPKEPANSEQFVGRLAEAAIGDALDSGELLPDTSQAGAELVLDCGRKLQEWQDRPRASDRAAIRYIESKLVASWQFDVPIPKVGPPDLIRLHMSDETFQRLIDWGDGSRWENLGFGDDEVLLRPKHVLLTERADLASPPPATDSIGEITRVLSSPRYAGPAAHWAKVRRFSNPPPERDPENAAKEAVAAVEALARIVIGDHSLTLGEAIKVLKKGGRLAPALGKALEGVWGFTSNAPGVRHGAAVLSPLASPEENFVVQTSAAAIKMLLALDGP